MSAYSESTRGARPRHTSGQEPRPVARGSRVAARQAPERGAARGSARSVTGAAARSGRPARSSARETAGRVGPRGAAGASGVVSWADTHRLACVVVVIVVALVAALYSPVKALYGAHRTNAVLAERLDAATASATQLQGEVDSLMTREGIEDEARRRGYVGEGETAVEVGGIEDSGSATTDESVTGDSSQTQGQDAQDPWYVSVLDFIFGYDPSTQGVG